MEKVDEVPFVDQKSNYRNSLVNAEKFKQLNDYYRELTFAHS